MSINPKQKKYLIFSLFFVGIFSATFIVLYFLGFVPEELLPSGNSPADTLKLSLFQNGTVDQPKDVSVKDVPIKIQIPEVGVNVNILDPNDPDNAVLNQYLLKGAVRYPGSGYPGNGNLFIFGHSSTLAVVNNQAFKAFNKIENLKAGDEISVYSSSTKYIYKVRDVRMVVASKEEVDLTTKENMLTLSTCDLLGATKEDRYVVRADYVGKTSL
ncbi:MAG: sortase [Candidatus Paceibacterota bacterium]